MPTYQYRCTECGHDLEAVQKFSDAALTECPNCGGQLRKIYNAVGVVFKGSGFYRTDSRKPEGSGEGGDSGSKVGGGKADGSGGSKDGGTNGSGSGAADKPATKSDSGSTTPAPATTAGSSSSTAASGAKKAS